MGYHGRCMCLTRLAVQLSQIFLQDDNLSNEVKNLKFLVLDEADRMIEVGHFAELENILRLTRRENKFVMS